MRSVIAIAVGGMKVNFALEIDGRSQQQSVLCHLRALIRMHKSHIAGGPCAHERAQQKKLRSLSRKESKLAKMEKHVEHTTFDAMQCIPSERLLPAVVSDGDNDSDSEAERIFSPSHALRDIIEQSDSELDRGSSKDATSSMGSTRPHSADARIAPRIAKVTISPLSVGDKLHEDGNVGVSTSESDNNSFHVGGEEEDATPGETLPRMPPASTPRMSTVLARLRLQNQTIISARLEEKQAPCLE
eukprot:TRINITY_DN6774_c0_g1_i1.p1 TRINITY_DN6774_c0_g1~~TRINITY_DN6774_c0_g1_i1.p1  ORF type:complete len:244 (+),score=43.97 TRINITY_DN6774_c0_g1_i1:44-775(+)